MPTTTNYGWTTPADTDLVKDGASAIRTLGTAIDTTVFNNASAGIAKTIVDAKGDIIAATAADTVSRLAVGSNGQYLAANSATATGLEWQTVSAGGITLIQETVASGLSSLSFSSIPSTYKNLLLTWNGIYHSTTGTIFNIRLNNNSNGVYNSRSNYSENTNFSEFTNNSATQLTNSGSQAPFGRDVTQTDLSLRGFGSLFIENYASSSKLKNIQGRWSFNWTGTASVKVFDFLGIFNDTTAITSLDIVRTSGSGTLENMADTSIRLYGLS